MSEIIVPEQTISGFAGDNGLYIAQAEGAFNRIMPSREYEIVFDGTKYTCIAWLLKEETSSSVGICVGNGYLAAGTGEDTGEPFLVVVELTEDGEFQCAVGTTHSGDSHVISITKTDAVLREQEFDGFSFGSGVNAMELNYSVADLIAGENYNLKIDGIDYQCEAKAESSDGMDAVVLGNLGLLSEDDFENTGESFLIVNISPIASEIPLGATLIVAQADSEKTSYTIGISLAEEAKTGVDIVLYDRTGEPVTYEGIETITTDTPTSGKRATFTYGTLLSGVEIGLNLKNGDQKISVPEGSLVKEAVVKKPTTLIPENILAGVDIAGVVGTHKDDTVLTDMEIPLDMTEGDQKLSVPDGYVVKTAVIKKPETLIPENIAKGVTIAGVVGTYKCTGYTTADIANGDMEGEVADATVSEIKNYAFGATKITKAAFPSCSSVGNYAFAECSLLSDIELDYVGISTVNTGTFMGTAISEMSLPSCTSIKANAFSGCRSLQKLYAPMCSALEENAFKECRSLSEITLSTAASVIRSRCFYGCVNLKDLGETDITKVYEEAFYNCYSLERVTFASTALPILLSDRAFRYCSNLSIVEGVLSLAGGTYEARALTSVFDGCCKLRSITFGYFSDPAGPPQYMFTGCSALSIVSLWSSTKVFAIDPNCFWSTPMSESGFLGKFGSIYVPSSLFYSFRTASGWSYYSSRMVSYKV